MNYKNDEFQSMYGEQFCKLILKQLRSAVTDLLYIMIAVVLMITIVKLFQIYYTCTYQYSG